MSYYTDHSIVRNALGTCSSAMRELKRLSESTLDEDKKKELSFNVENNVKQIRKIAKMLKQTDSTVVAKVDLKEANDWVEVSVSDAVLLKIDQLNDILERKVDKIEQALKPPRLTREQKIAILLMERKDNSLKGF